MSEVKLLDVNCDWKQERPFLKKNNDEFIVTGYQSYGISKSGIMALSPNTKTKLDLIKNSFYKDISGRTVSDIGCANMFFGFLSLYSGASQVTGIELDVDYLLQNAQIISELNLQNISCNRMNAVDYKVKTDVVFAFAIIHWVYSCTGFLGSLENVVKHFRSITNHVLYIEWIDPSDDCISNMLHHLDFNKDLATQDYNKKNFIKYLTDNFRYVEFIGKTKSTREIYRCGDK